MNCLWILVLLCLCTGSNDCNNQSGRGCNRNGRDCGNGDGGCNRNGRDGGNRDSGCNRNGRDGGNRDNDCRDGSDRERARDGIRERSFEEGAYRMPSSFQRNTCGCEIQEE